MAPMSFLRRPYHWLKAISHYRVTHAAGPDFAYVFCVHENFRAEGNSSSWGVSKTC